MAQSIDHYTNDVTQLKLRLLDELVFSPINSRGDITYRIEVPSRHKFFSVGYEEYVFISLLDGNTTPAQACGLAAQALGREALTQTQANMIVRWLMTNRLVDASTGDLAADVAIREREDASTATLFGKLNPFWMKIPVIRSEHAIRSVTPLLSWMFDIRFVVAATIMMLVAILTVGLQFDRFIDSSTNIFSSGAWIWTLATWIILKMIHELAHAAACHRYGGDTSEVGIVMVLFAPLAYVDVTSSWRLRSKWQRMAIAAAGMYVELTVAALAAIAWGYSDSVQLSHILFNVVFAASVSTVIFNANPLMKFDGYYILADLLEIPNLYTDGSKAVRQCASRFFFARGTLRGQASGWRRGFVMGYGFASLIWRVLICFSLAAGAAYMFKGAGIALVVIGCIGWIVKPVANLIKTVNEKLTLDPPAGLRAIVVGTSVVLILTGTIFYLPISTSNVSPAVVDYVDGSVLRSDAAGFITEVVVENGRRVKRGDVLMRLQNPELQQQRFDLQTQIKQSEIRERLANQAHELSSAQMERESRRAIQDRLSQVEEQIAGLVVRAHREGTVIARELPSRKGTYVEEGDEILVIADSSDIELVVSIAQQDITTATDFVGHSVSIRTASQFSLEGQLSRIEPIAAKRVPHEALAGTNAGALPVRAAKNSEDNDSGELELLEPRFKAVVEVDPSICAMLPTGQRVRVFLGHQRLTIYQRIRIQIDKLLREARENAA